MSAAKHTPAIEKHWKCIGHRTIVTDDAGALLICEVFSGGIGVKDADQVERLIAAAPELLEALEAMLRYYTLAGDASPVAVRGRAAIAKATGSAS